MKSRNFTILQIRDMIDCINKLAEQEGIIVESDLIETDNKENKPIRRAVEKDGKILLELY